MNTRLSLFNSPLMLGFDHIEQMLDRVSKTSGDGYPPYNIEQTSEQGLRITLAVAGFTADDLSIQQEDQQLIIKGKHSEESKDRVFIHRGIASRQFQKTFVLDKGIEITGATLNNGLLHIDLMRPLPEARVKTIKIQNGAKTSASQDISIDAV